MKIEKKKVKDLKFYKNNPRIMSEDMLSKLERSIKEFGVVEPLVVNQENEVIGGNQRLEVLRRLGIEEVETVVVDFPKSKERALNLALNKIEGQFDLELLSDFIKEIEIQDLELTGFSEVELNLLDIDVNPVEISDETEELIDSEENYRVVIVFPSKEVAEDWLEENHFDKKFKPGGRILTIKW